MTNSERSHLCVFDSCAHEYAGPGDQVRIAASAAVSNTVVRRRLPVFPIVAEVAPEIAVSVAMDTILHFAVMGAGDNKSRWGKYVNRRTS